MKKLLSLALLLLAITACGTKDSVEKATTTTPTESSDEMVFVRKLDSTQASISRAQVTQNIYDSTQLIIKGYYDGLVSIINQKTGRNVPNDSYFVFDKNGNILELAIKSLANDNSKTAAIFQYDIVPNNIPVFLEKDHFTYSYSNTIVTTGHDYWYSKSEKSNNILSKSQISTSIDPSNNLYVESTNSKRYIKYDMQNRISEISIDTYGMLLVKEDEGVLPEFIDSTGSHINNFGSYENLKMVYNYDTNEGTLYSNDAPIGTTKDFKIDYQISNGKINSFSIDTNTTDESKTLEIFYNNLGNVTKIQTPYGKKEFNYDNNNPYILKNYNESSTSNLFSQSISNAFTTTNDGKIASFDSTIVTNWTSGNGPETSTEILSFKYNRDSNGNIFEVITDLNLMDGVRLKGTFIPKQ